MYFVDRKLLEERIVYIEDLLSFLGKVHTPASQMERLASQRAIHMLVEAILDVGNQMIDGFIMKDPGSYEDIIHVLDDEQVVTEREAKLLVAFISVRKMLVREYTRVDMQQIWTQYKRAERALQVFPARIRTYLTEHLGPVSAFGFGSN